MQTGAYFFLASGLPFLGSSLAMAPFCTATTVEKAAAATASTAALLPRAASSLTSSLAAFTTKTRRRLPAEGLSEMTAPPRKEADKVRDAILGAMIFSRRRVFLNAPQLVLGLSHKKRKRRSDRWGVVGRRLGRGLSYPLGFWPIGDCHVVVFESGSYLHVMGGQTLISSLSLSLSLYH